jgi:hypothetical protein
MFLNFEVHSITSHFYNILYSRKKNYENMSIQLVLKTLAVTPLAQQTLKETILGKLITTSKIKLFFMFPAKAPVLPFQGHWNFSP